MNLTVGIVAKAVAEAHPDHPNEVALARWFFAYCRQKQGIWKLVCKRVGVEPELAWRVWNGDADAKQLGAFSEAVIAFQKKCGAESHHAYAETSYTQAAMELFNVALRRSARGSPSLFYLQGDAGCGKSVASRAFAQQHIGNAYLYEVPGQVGYSGLVRDVAKTLGSNPNSSFNQLFFYVQDWFQSGMMVIVDEAHFMVDAEKRDQKKLDFWRRLSDIKKISVVFTVTEDTFERGLSTSSYNHLQLVRRFGRTRFLNWRPKDGDIRSLFRFKCPHLDMGDEMFNSFRSAVDHEEGGFGIIGRVIEDAEDLAANDEREVTLKDISISLADAIGAKTADGKVIRESSLDKLRDRMNRRNGRRN